MGSSWGPVVSRDVDYLGRTVNVAARVTDYARPGEVIVTGAVAYAVAAEGGLDLQELGPVSLKGVRDPVPLFSVPSPT